MTLEELLSQYMPGDDAIRNIGEFFSVFSQETRIKIIILLSVSNLFLLQSVSLYSVLLPSVFPKSRPPIFRGLEFCFSEVLTSVFPKSWPSIIRSLDLRLSEVLTSVFPRSWFLFFRSLLFSGKVFDVDQGGPSLALPHPLNQTNSFLGVQFIE